MIQTASRLALVMFALWAMASLFEPNHDASRLAIAADAVEHGLIAFGLVVLGAGAAPRVPILAITGAVVFIGWAVEGLQYAQVIGGQFQATDIVADLIGAVLGAFAVSFGEARAAEAQANPGAAPEL
jgi:VanZ family protein